MLSRRRQPGPLRRAVFLDKDGTLVEDVPYNVDPDKVRLAQGAVESLARLQEAGYLLVVITNQSGVARGYATEEAIAGLAAHLGALLAAGGVTLNGFHYCPHHPEGAVPGYDRACSCRKPAPGLLLRAAAEHGIDLAASWFIGDILDDMEAAHHAGCRGILIDNGNETEWFLPAWRQPHCVVDDLAAAADIILADPAGRGRQVGAERGGPAG